MVCPEPGEPSKGEQVHKKLVLIPIILLFLSGCLSATPFQSARVVEDEEFDLTGSVMRSTQKTYNGSSGWTQVEIAGHNALKGGRAEFEVNGSMLVYDSSSFGGTLGAGMKLEIIDDMFSIELPAKFVIGGTNPIDTTHFYPRLIASFPLGEMVELNLSATKFFYARGGLDGPSGFSAGFAFGKRGGTIVRPEFGVLIYPYDDEPTYQFGIGITTASKKTQPINTEYDSTPH